MRKMYGVWQNAKGDQYFNQYTTIEDAVADEGRGAKVFLLVPQLLGKFALTATPIKKKRAIKKLKKSRKARKK